MDRKYELLHLIESENPMWYQSIEDDAPRLLELREAWLGKNKTMLKHRYKYTDENLITLIRHGYTVPELTEITDAPKYAIKNRIRLHENVKQVWKTAVQARKTLVIEKDNKTTLAVGGLKAAGKVLHIRPSRVRNIMNNMNSGYDISWYFDCYDTIDELEEYLHENEKRK
ncbi:hypothetical protein [Liquorilactobacillus nagelii]|uniref:hypothetical protein n=1 Tax=Liquorilactobacillus nagelii TaxID=82688 RepID=UPI001CCB192C|nr:hypothetical protein [Liquorilactobacillus nagelii]ULQ49037.1 hypothetical protein J6864_08715 [Liquorilactobacillus nagelii]